MGLVRRVILSIGPDFITRTSYVQYENTSVFEAKLAELEALVQQIEQGSMPLDKSLEALSRESRSPKMSFYSGYCLPKSDRNQTIRRRSAF